MCPKCGWCQNAIESEEVVSLDHLLFHVRCVQEYINYCRLMKSLCEEDMRRLP